MWHALRGGSGNTTGVGDWRSVERLHRLFLFFPLQNDRLGVGILEASIGALSPLGLGWIS